MDSLKEVKKEENLSDRIKALRKQKGLTQLQLGDILHITDKAVSKWESNEGNPDISLLSSLAKVFDVSIDYLLTGDSTKTTEVITMNKIELCCKNDSVEQYNEIRNLSIKSKDENGLSILDYIKKYDSEKVFKDIINKFNVQSPELHNNFEILKLLIHFNMIDKLQQMGLFLPAFDGSGKCFGIYSDNIMQYVMTEDTINKEFLDRYFSLHKKDMVNPKIWWQDLYKKAFEIAVLNNKESMIYYVWNIIKEINQSSNNEFLHKQKDNTSTYRLSFQSKSDTRGFNYSMIYNYAVVLITSETIRKIIENGYIDLADEINENNKVVGGPIVQDSELQVAKMKRDGKTSEEEIFLTSCLDNGIISFEKLIKSNDLQLVQRGLNEYPSCLYDLMMKWFNEKRFDKLFMFSIDNNCHNLSHVLSSTENIDDIRKEVLQCSYDLNAQVLATNKKYLYTNSKYPTKVNRELFEEQIKAAKDTFINDLKLKLDKDKLTKDITKEYLDVMLNNGEYQLLIIKLCVKLEAIFKCDYHLTGTFEEMMNRYNSKNDFVDDEDGYAGESERSILFNKLRKQRNGIVHAEIGSDQLNQNQLKKLIAYVCELE